MRAGESLHAQPHAPRPTHMGAGGVVAEGVLVLAGHFGGSARDGGGRALPSLLLTAGCCVCAGEPRCAAAAAGRLQGGGEGVLHGGKQDLRGPGRDSDARTRPAGRSEGARHRWGQGHASVGGLPRQHGPDQMPPQPGPPPPRRLRCHTPPARPTHTRRCPRPYASAKASAAAPQPSLHEQPLAPQPTHGCGRDGGRGRGAGWLLRWQRQRGRRPSPASLLLTAGGCVRR